MGTINNAMCRLLGVKEYFADFWNGTVLAGKYKIYTAQLSRDEKEYYKILRKSTSVQRDVLMKLCGEMTCMLGIEVMETIDYTIPARLMDYNAQEIKRQLNDIAMRNKRLVEIEQISWEHGGEFLYGVKKADRILPVLTVALYCGWEAYDGAYGILEMSNMDNVTEEGETLFRDYPIQLYSLKELDENNFQTGLRELIAIFKRSKDRQAMKEYFLRNKEHFRQLDNFVIDAMGALIGIEKLRLFTQEGRGLDLCKAFDDERIEGENRMAQLFQKLLQLNRLDDCRKVSEDDKYRQQMFREFGIN